MGRLGSNQNLRQSRGVSLVANARRRPPAMPGAACQKSLFDKLVDGGASSPARCRASNLRFEPWQFRLWRNLKTLWVFSLADFARISSKSPGAKSARKRFLLWKMGFSAAKIAPAAANRNLRFRFAGREATCLPFGQATFHRACRWARF